MINELNGIEFDPGFAPYILAFQGSVDYLYSDINRFKNFSQKKMKFMQYYKKILSIFENNLGFYTGCLMWASYIKTQPKQRILSNHCLGQKYDETLNVSDIDFLIQFTNLFPKDMKYYFGKDFTFDKKYLELLNIYKEFLIINKGFVQSEFNTDIKLPNRVNEQNALDYKTHIEEVLKTEDLSKLLEYLPTILKG